MKMVNCFLKKTFFLVLIAAILVSSCSIGAFAASGDYTGPTITKTELNFVRSVITLTFNQNIKAATSSYKSKIKISEGGKSLTSLPSSTKVSISDDQMTITFSDGLEKADTYIAITAGTLVGQDIQLESAVLDASGPALSSTKPVTVSANRRKVTLKFDSAIKGYPNNDTLKNGYISLARKGSSFTEVIPAEDIDIDSSAGEIEITLDEPLDGDKSKFRIAAGILQNTDNGNINISAITTAAIRTSDGSDSDDDYEGDMPEIKSTSISSDLKTVTIYFTKKIKNAFASTGTDSALAETFLRSHIQISRGDLNSFETLSGGDKITVGSNYVKIVFNEALIDKSNYILFDRNALTDYEGNPFTHDIITNSVTDSKTSSASLPEYSSVSASGSNTVRVRFTLPIIRNSDITYNQLLSSISISRNGSSFTKLTSRDSVSFSSSTMTITLDEPLDGSRNRVRIAADTLTSKSGIPIEKIITTDYFSTSGSSTDDYNEPEYEKVSYDAASGRIRVYFEKSIKVTSSADLFDSISISRNGSAFKALDYNDVVTISPNNAVSILLDKPLSGSKNAIKIAKGTLADYSTGYVLNAVVTTDYFSTSAYEDDEEDDDSSNGSKQYSGDVNVSVSDDFYTITLQFSEPVYNNLETLEKLKEKIQISKNGKFSKLTSDDYIRINEASNELLLVLAEPASDYFSRVKILSGALCDASDDAISTVITTLPLGEAEGDARAYVNDKAVSYIVSSEENSSAVVATLENANDLTFLSKSSEFLIKLPTNKSAATLNISSAVVSKVKSLSGTFALSFGNATYYLPANNIPTLASGDSVSIKISKASSVAQSLTVASTSNSFQTKSSATSLNASVVSASGATTPIKHTAFAKKRLMLEETNANTFYSVVRIEASGAVVPVPASTESSNGITYLTASTLADGNYAAISAVHTFTNTPSWVVVPANTLGSKLILANESGSDLNANQAISRAETVTIMAKTLGVFGDAAGASPFFDMLPSDSYFNAVMSAVSYSLISGYPDGTFKPSGKLTRAEAMTIVARAMRFLNGKSVSASSEMSVAEATTVLSKFADAGTVDNWAKADIAECVKAGVVNGDNNGRLNPKSQVTRAELIQLMYNLLSKADLL